MMFWEWVFWSHNEPQRVETETSNVNQPKWLREYASFNTLH